MPLWTNYVELRDTIKARFTRSDNDGSSTTFLIVTTKDMIEIIH